MLIHNGLSNARNGGVSCRLTGKQAVTRDAGISLLGWGCVWEEVREAPGGWVWKNKGGGRGGQAAASGPQWGTNQVMLT